MADRDNDKLMGLDQIDEEVSIAEEEEGEWAEFTAVKEELAEFKDRFLRLAADMENLRKRGEREKAEAALYAASNFARDLLSVADNLGRALEVAQQTSMDEDQQSQGSSSKTGSNFKSLIEGVEVTQRELLSVFARHGIRRLETLGQKFDPHYHQAMFEIPTTEKPGGTIMQELQAGYAIGERCLRPALVGVAKSERSTI